jgi:GGDEF domain-containing protein
MKDYFLHMSIAKKMLVGYVSISAITITLALVSLLTLERLNNINRSIMEVNTPQLEALEKMRDVMLSQELFARRYVILKSPDMLEMFEERAAEFGRLITKMETLTSGEKSTLEVLSRNHGRYTDDLREALPHLMNPGSLKAKTHNDAIHEAQMALFSTINQLAQSARTDQEQKVRLVSESGSRAFLAIVILCGLGISIGIGSVLLITRTIAASVGKLMTATRQIAQGTFDNLPVVPYRDELGTLSSAFAEMAKRLQSLEEMYLDASPLTHLPGGVAIENVLKKRLVSGQPLAFCLVDMDNFKAYNDYYGYVKGNDLILATARVIEEAASEHGTDEDFRGHIGGDDFVIITTPERHREICAAVVEKFDGLAPDFYHEKDRTRGFITGKTRQGDEVQFPLVTLSIAVVTNQSRTFDSHIEVGEVAAELKEYAKGIPGSLYVVDQRRNRA